MEIKYEDIKKANETIITTNIKGKEYAEVNQRIKAFRMVYPEGAIETELESNVNGVCIFKAYVYGKKVWNENTGWTSTLLGTGTAYEKENSTFINKTSYIENCETSAVGRALGMAGFGIDTSVASFEEVANAIQQQEIITNQDYKQNNQELKASEAQLKYIKSIIPEQNIPNLLEYYKIKKLEELSMKNASDLIERKQHDIK